MSLTPTIYQSTDPGAPQLGSQAGALLALLRAVLVQGYGSGPATKPPLGWTEAFTDTNKAVFRNNPVTGSGRYVRIDDAGPQYALVHGFLTMSDVDTGTGEFPTAAQKNAGNAWIKASEPDGVNLPWWLIGNERAFYLFIGTSSTSSYAGLSNSVAYFAGDLLSLRPGDSTHFVVSNGADNLSSIYSHSVHSRLFGDAGALAANPSATSCACYAGTNFDGTSGPVALNHTYGLVDAPYLGYFGLPYPYPVTNGLIWERAFMHEAANTFRGSLPGVIAPVHARTFSDLHVLTDLPDMPDGSELVVKHFVGQAPGYASSYPIHVMFETALPWQ